MRSADELDGSEPAEEALPILVDAHGGRLYALGLRLCGDPEEARDLVQETFLQAFRKWEQFEGRARASTWLYTIAARLCQRFHRKRSGEPERLESLEELLPLAEERMAVVPDADDGPLGREQRAEARRRAEEAIAALPVAFRMPFVLKEVVGLGVADVARILNLKPATVKTRLHRGRLRVRRALEAVLPRRALPAPRFARRVCLDLLRAKQECLDRGDAFAFPDGSVCERCAELFATLDLGQEVCAEVARGDLPGALRRELLAVARGPS